MTLADTIIVEEWGYYRLSRGLYRWDGERADQLAALDYINPPTGEALGDVLFGLNGAPNEPEPYQIIRR